jgi:tripartite-type tricarboxylate transporter receptor subunit TctC
MTGWKSIALTAAAASLWMAGTAAMADNYPSQQINYILHVQPGGATDIMARRLAEAIQNETGQTVVVENRPGGSGARQMAVLTRAEPDGYTIGSVTSSHFGMFAQTGQFDIDDVEWACSLVLDPFLLAMRSDSGIDSMQELVDRARENPGQLSVAGFGEGSGGQIAWKMFEESAGLTNDEIVWVPYDSVGDAVVAVLGGHNDVAIAYVDLVRQHVEAGTLQVIGIHADETPEALEGVPTYTEAGFDIDTSWQQMRGIIMPPGTPLDVQQQFCDVVERAMQSDDFRRYLVDAELIVGFRGPEGFAGLAQQQDQLTRDWLERLNQGN